MGGKPGCLNSVDDSFSGSRWLYMTWCFVDKTLSSVQPLVGVSLFFKDLIA
jgi:hypothetical protein